MQSVELTQGFSALVDDEDFERVNALNWFIKKDRRKNTNYAVLADGTRMHRFIMGLPRGNSPLVDHGDQNGLNNQRYNLRICTYGQNRANTKKSKGTSQFKGVHKTSYGTWTVQIKSNKSAKYLGTFKDEVQAALAYDAAARELFGEFACCNFAPRKPCVGIPPACMISLSEPRA